MRPRRTYNFVKQYTPTAVQTCICELSAHRQHHLPVAGSVGHELQDLLVRFAFDWNAVDTDELIAGPQPAVFLRSAQRYDGTDVDLITKMRVTCITAMHAAHEITTIPIILSSKNTYVIDIFLVSFEKPWMS